MLILIVFFAIGWRWYGPRPPDVDDVISFYIVKAVTVATLTVLAYGAAMMLVAGAVL